MITKINRVSLVHVVLIYLHKDGQDKLFMFTLNVVNNTGFYQL